MSYDINYESIDAYAAEIKRIATDIQQIERALNYYYYGSIMPEGDFASAFRQMEAVVQGLANDMAAFMDGYADIVSGVARNLEIMDTEISRLIRSVKMVWEK